MDIPLVAIRVYVLEFQPFKVFIHETTKRLTLEPNVFLEGCCVTTKRVFTSEHSAGMRELGFGMITIPTSDQPPIVIEVTFKPTGWEWCRSALMSLLDYKLEISGNVIVMKALRYMPRSMPFYGDSFTVNLAKFIPQRIIVRLSEQVEVHETSEVVIHAAQVYSNYDKFEVSEFLVSGFPYGMILVADEYLVFTAHVDDEAGSIKYRYLAHAR
jgi:hypothetical protein